MRDKEKVGTQSGRRIKEQNQNKEQELKNKE